MAKGGKKKTRFECGNEVLSHLKETLVKSDHGDIAAEIYLPESDAELIALASRITTYRQLLASRDFELIKELPFLKPVLSIKDKILFSDIELEAGQVSESHEALFSYIELIYKSITNTKRYNEYLNVRHHFLKQFEDKAKLKMRKQMKRMMPLIKRLVDSIDKEAKDELLEMIKTKEYVNMGKEIFQRLMASNFDIEAAFNDFDLSELNLE